MKSFTDSPNFDISSFRGYINEVIEKPWKLRADYLLLRYEMDGEGVVTIADMWMKKVWEICCTSERWPLKVQYRNGVINNIRPCVWYSQRPSHKPFTCMEHFLAALEETIFRYPDTHAMAATWAGRLRASYEARYGEELRLPRWEDVREEYA